MNNRSNIIYLDPSVFGLNTGKTDQKTQRLEYRDSGSVYETAVQVWLIAISCMAALGCLLESNMISI